MIRLILISVTSLVFGSLAIADAAPPPRSERAPFTEGRPGSPPAFTQTDWRPGYPIPPSWRPRYFYYETKYDLHPSPAGPILQTYADGTASWIRRSFSHRFEADQTACINWTWSADRLPTLTASETTKAGDDFAIRLYVFGRSVSGARYGFNYVWSNQHDPGSIWTSPYSNNKLMALQKGPNPSGQMIPESRDLIADLEAATGARPLTIESIAIMTDAEGSSSVAEARISEVLIGPCQIAVA